MNITQAGKEDVKAILELQTLAFFDHIDLYQDSTLPMLTQTVESLIEEMKEKTVLKYTHQGVIIGSVRAYCKDKTCFIEKVIVHPAYQHQGVGKKLMDAIEKAFHFCKRYELYTGSKSLSNLKFYRKLGYSIFKSVRQNNVYSLEYFEKHVTHAESTLKIVN